MSENSLSRIDMIVLVLDSDLFCHEGVKRGSSLGSLTSSTLDQLRRVRVTRLQWILENKFKYLCLF